MDFYFQFAFEGKRGESYQGDIALDDLRVLDGSCPLLRKLKFLDCYFFLCLEYLMHESQTVL